MRLFVICQIFFLVIKSDWVTAQSKGWQELTISNGLSQGMIFDLEQDRKGFIWIATKDGLNRYDGYNFKVFTHDPYNPYSLSDNTCSALLMDRHNRLWIGTLNKGLNLYDERTQRFYHIVIRDQKVPDGASYEVRLLAEDPQGNIWVGTGTGQPFKITLPASLQQNFPNQPDFTNQIQLSQLQLNTKVYNSLNLDFSFKPNGEGLTGLNNGIYAFNWKKPTGLTKLNLFPNDSSGIFDFYHDVRQDFLVISTSHQLKCWYKGVAKTIALPLSSGQGVKIKPIDGHTIALSVASHLWLFSPAALFGKDSLTEQNAFLTFPPNLYAVTKLFRDKTGNIWVGTSGYGIRKFNPRVNQFHSYLPRTSLSQLYVDQQGRTYGRYQDAYGLIDRQSTQLLPFIDSKLPEADRKQSFLMQDRQGFFWISNTHFQTHVSGLFKFSSDWHLLRKYPLPTGLEFGYWVNLTLEDPDGKLWMGAMKGKLLRFDPKTESFQVFSYLPGSNNEAETYALLREPNGTFWIGTQQGLIRAEHLTTKPAYTYYTNSTTNRQSLSNNFVLSLANDPNEPDRYLWIGTKGGGLERLDKKTGQFNHFTEAQGLPNKVVYGILVDEFRNLWLSTNRGLSQFNPKTEHFRNYTQADGLQDDEFNTGSFFKSASGEMLFGGVNGLNTFLPSELAKVNQLPPTVNIIALRINNKPIEVRGPDEVLLQGIEYTQQLDLRHDQNLLTFEFGVMDYTNSANNQYRYRLQGIDGDWVEAGTNRFANYAQLPSGNYQLQMMGSVDGEHWSKPLELQIRIHPPFYRTWWAYLFYLIVIGLVIWWLNRLQTQRLLLQQQVAFEQKEAGRLAELDSLKTRFFTNISHEFRTPLTLLLGPINDLRQRHPTDMLYQVMYRNANRLQSLIGQLLELAKLDAGELQLDKQPGNLVDDIRIWIASFESLAQSRGITLSLTQNRPQQWKLYDADKLEKIVTNLISNALKFTPAGGNVQVDVLYHETRSVTIYVRDTGVGIAPDQVKNIFDRFYQADDSQQRGYEGTGIGLALVKELVTAMKGQIRVESQPGRGTTFVLNLTLEQAEASAQLSSGEIERDSSEFTVQEAVTQAIPLTTDLETSSDKTVLIVEDNDDLRLYIRHVLEPIYTVIEAVDGQDGLNRAVEMLPDLVICDLMMPRLDGFGFCKQLKTLEATSHIPVVMLTAKADMDSRIEGLTIGADDYLTKPFDRQELQLRVRNLLLQRERLFEWFTANQGPRPVAPPALTAEQKFLDRLSEEVFKHIDDPDFSVEALAEAVNLSRVQLHRKLKALTNTTATNFIRDIRLAQAATLLATQTDSVTQVAYAVGFDNLSYFAKVFQEKYGVLPSQYGKPSLPESQNRSPD
ncbi:MULTISPECIES: ATP-binding protein [unclassified Spirosoma]|uniref:hybrid sensor histidine kinase/response regulator transcription factor n=1 Tax=unclassified Spirosoma TaxID=2621999 RepID=UPI000967DD9E|nr:MULTISPECIES: ATP-binding protein [unclassified Spirosoma]MBN8826111.1 response regulator [Spirosoma sp.]OJW74595.1 MAG: hybrid sensor histidine kinase/response regulator [Spirosoma sp. 48-14]